MQFSELNRLLNASPMPLELGYERLASGVLHIAVRTDMHGCTGVTSSRNTVVIERFKNRRARDSVRVLTVPGDLEALALAA